MFVIQWQQASKKAVDEEHCSASVERRIVRGKSLEPLVREGQAVTIYVGMHRCRPLRAGDVVAYRYAGNPEPLVKPAPSTLRQN